MDNFVSPVGDTNQISGTGRVEKNAEGALEAPKNIIMNVSAAKTYYNNFRQSHIPRIRLFAAIEGLIAGNPPYDATKLESAGLSHIANVNTLDAKGLFERAALTFWNLVNQTETLVKFKIRPFEMGQDQEFEGWAEILARNWTKVMKEQWEDFIPQINMLTAQLVKFGVSPIVWSDEEDFRWKTVDLSRFFVADMTPVTLADWDCICVETTFTLQYLYSVYENLKDDDTSPWQKDALADYIVRRASMASKAANSGVSGFTNILEMQQRLQNGDLNQGMIFSDSVRLVSLLKKEYSGDISHYIFDPLGAGGEQFLFQVTGQYKSFREACVVFTYSPGEMYIHGNRGVGHKIYPVCQALMQLDCNMLDMAKMAGTPIIKSNSTVGKGIEPIRFIHGVATDVGAAEFVQNQLGANLNQVVEVAQYMERKVNKNAMLGGDDPGMPDQDRGSKSAPEVQMQSLKEFGVGKQNVAHFYKNMDIVYVQMAIKMLHCKEGHPSYPIVKEWKELCMEEGVPAEIFETKDSDKSKLPRHLEVKASRVAGDGSNLALQVGLSRVSGISGGFGAKGQANYRKDLITSNLGIDYTERYLSDADEPDESMGGASLATVENFMLQQGAMPQATQDNQHKAHIASHLSVIMNAIQQVQAQQMDPIAADKLFQMAIEHTGAHIQFISQDLLNASFLQQILGPWKQINKFAQLNRVRAQKMMQTEVRRRAEAEQEMTADMLDQERKDKVALIEQNRKDRESDAKLERAKEASKTKGEMMKKSVENKAENERLAIKLKDDNSNVVKKPQDILANQSTTQLQSTLSGQVGQTPNPVDFK